MTLPFRATVDVFAPTDTVNERFPLQVANEMLGVSQVAVRDKVQFILLVTFTVGDVQPAAKMLVHPVGDTVKVAGGTAPSCAKLIFRVIPLPLTVTLPFRVAVDVFAATDTVNERFPLQVANEMLGVSQVTVRDKVQFILLVTFIVGDVQPAAKTLLHPGGATVSVAAGAPNCAKLIFRVIPLPLTVILPFRAAVDVFAATDTVN